ncbi:hypothetical protein J2Z48_001746 [Croceifilum oryzae]|uniref:DUF3987 domain-containing protein n=1 Tax=Croceifilum oryzae TaxID=1553429 RepID=A0AAJ1TET7_9BACL|nr:DUF3987 domain-containing protein [Croceifilum oryzae]MDQ0417573.1 hypothetical protein [Croceifilum oryzae]
METELQLYEINTPYIHIPNELKELDQWVLYNDSKAPMQVDNTFAKPNDPSTWNDYWAVLEAKKNRSRDFRGIGFVVQKSNGYVLIDIDQCRDRETSAIQDWAVEIIQKCNSYTEVSPSGTGVHIFVRGKKIRNGNKKRLHNGAIEIYDERRYFTMTGHHVAGTPTEIMNRSQEIADICNTYLTDSSPGKEVPNGITPSLTDAEIIKRASNDKNGTEFQRFFFSGHGEDESSSEMIVCNHLAFYTQDPDQIYRILQNSMLVRDKWDKPIRTGGESYIMYTIQKAIESTTHHYDPTIHTHPPVLEEEEITSPRQVEVLPFPVDIFSAPVRNFIEEVTRSINIPTDLVAHHVTPVLGTAIGNVAEVQISNGFVGKSNLYSLLLAPSGSAKTPGFNHAVAPLKKIQRKMYQKYRNEWDFYEMELQQYQTEKSQWKKGEEIPEPPKEPILQEIYAEDTTTEGLKETLYNNKRGIILLHDEMRGLFNGLNQYRGGKGNDADFYLKLWNGDDIKVNRKGDRPKYITEPFAAMAGSIQPSEFNKLGIVKDDGDGFLSRFLISYPEVPKIRDLVWTSPDPKTIEEYEEFVQKLEMIPYGEKPIPILVNSEAEYQLNVWHFTHIRESHAHDPDTRMAWNKMLNHLLRILLIIHVMRHVNGEVELELADEESMDRAIRLIEYYKSHAIKVYAKSKNINPQDTILEKMAEYVEACGGQLSARDAQRNKGNLFGKKKKTVLANLQKLVDEGYGTIQKEKAGKSNREVWIFHLS